jgi:ribosomal protein S27AE
VFSVRRLRAAPERVIVASSGVMDTAERSRPEYLVDFIDEVLVECPRCGEEAIVVATDGFRAAAPAVRCAKCGFSRAGWPAPDGAVIDAVAKRRCPRCGRWLEKRYQRVLAKRREVVLSCPCKAQTAVARRFASVRLGEPYDPYFGYPLWLQKAIGRNVLWAYNRRHLAFLKGFVAANMRPRTPGANGSLASRLPAWITKGTRRANVLRAIQALQRRAA